MARNEVTKSAMCAPPRNVASVHHTGRDADPLSSVNSPLDSLSSLSDKAPSAVHDERRDRLGGNARRATPSQPSAAPKPRHRRGCRGGEKARSGWQPQAAPSQAPSYSQSVHRTLERGLREGPMRSKRACSRSRSRSRSCSPKRSRLFDRSAADEQRRLVDVLRTQAADLAERELEQRNALKTQEAEIIWLRKELANARWDLYSNDREVDQDPAARKLFVDNEYAMLCQHTELSNFDPGDMKGSDLECDLKTAALDQKGTRSPKREPGDGTSLSDSVLGLELVGEFKAVSGEAEPALSQDETGARGDDLDGAMVAAAEDASAIPDLRDPMVASIEDVLKALPAASFDAPAHEAVWQLTKGHQVPMPLGRYGHPYRRGWLWGSIDPRRVFEDCRSGGRLEKDSPDYVQLAREAVCLPFAWRSVTQRIVVGWAHHQGVLPLPGFCAEPDVLFECRRNPEKVTNAVRRHNTVDRERRRLYTVWDVLDLDCNILLRMSRPTPPPRSQRRPASQTEGPSWPDLVRQALEDASARGTDHPGVEPYEHGPRPYEGPGDPEDVFLHLRRCGFALGRMLDESGNPAASELGQYIARLDSVEEQRKLYTEKHNALSAGSESSAAAVRWDRRRYLSLNIEVAPVPEGRPVVRTSTALIEGHTYYFGRDGVLRYTSKGAS